jgi:hypothetical protein
MFLLNIVSFYFYFLLVCLCSEKECHNNIFITCNWPWSTNANTGHDMDIDTSTPIIIWENDMIQCNHMCRCRTLPRVRHLDTLNPRSVCASLVIEHIPFLFVSWTNLDLVKDNWETKLYGRDYKRKFEINSSSLCLPHKTYYASTFSSFWVLSFLNSLEQRLFDFL